jgi:hypothetical protein
MASSLWVSRLLYLAAKLGLADLVASGTNTPQAIAAKTKTHERSMQRVLRALGCIGIVEQKPDGTIAMTELGDTLRSDHPGKARSTVLMVGGPWMWQSWGEFEYSVATGKTATEKVLGMPAFDYLAKHPDQASIFNEAMVGIHGQEPAAVAEAYDFSGFGTVVDVGGGTGNLIAAILKKYPQPAGVIYDLPHVVKERRPSSGRSASPTGSRRGGELLRARASGRRRVRPLPRHPRLERGAVPDDPGHCRKAMKPGAKLLIVEMVLPDGNEPHPERCSTW